MIKLKRILKSFVYAGRGVEKIFKEEQNFRIQTFCAFLVLVVAFYFDINSRDWAVLILVIGLVLLMEALNSAVERVVDILKPRLDSYIKEIKDIMAAAVMIASLIAVIVGAIIFIPYF